MYLKSLKIKHFRKFKDEDNLIEFVAWKDVQKGTEDINVARAATLIVGKNNSGKTTITRALEKLIEKKEFYANDYNFEYLNKLLWQCIDNDKWIPPILEFKVEVAFDFNSDRDYVSNIAPFLDISSAVSSDQEYCFKVIIKREIKEEEKLKKDIKSLIDKYWLCPCKLDDKASNEINALSAMLKKHGRNIDIPKTHKELNELVVNPNLEEMIGEEKKKSTKTNNHSKQRLSGLCPQVVNQNVININTLFRKYIELINNSVFVLKYYKADNTPIADDKFKIKDLINVHIINANKKIDDNSLSNTFNAIIKCRNESKTISGLASVVEDKIEGINTDMTRMVADEHTNTLNEALGKIESSSRLKVSLSADLTFEKLMSDIIKYEYMEGNYHVPESQYGLGYANLMAIIGALIEYIEKYPEQECHSKINLICIEEPEAFMHSQMQEQFIKHIDEAVQYLLKDRKKNINSQLIITTHSPHILNSKIHHSVSFNNISYVTIVNNYSKVVNMKDENVMGDRGGTTDKENDLKYIKKHIKYKVSELFFADAIIFVEGITEETLLSYYIDQNPNLNKYYISVININGAHAKVYRKLIKMLTIPVLIITDIDIKKDEKEKKNYEQIDALQGRTTTNQTIIEYNSNEDLENIASYFQDENIYMVFQREAISGYFATSLEEAIILTNHNNAVMQAALERIKPNIYNEIKTKHGGDLKKGSYELQRRLSDDKSNFANELLYQILITDEAEEHPKLPKYVNDGLVWLTDRIIKQLNYGD
jgi:predicted ATP-dependent endonuclease of OLD family